MHAAKSFAKDFHESFAGTSKCQDSVGRITLPMLMNLPNLRKREGYKEKYMEWWAKPHDSW